MRTCDEVQFDGFSADVFELDFFRLHVFWFCFAEKDESIDQTDAQNVMIFKSSFDGIKLLISQLDSKRVSFVVNTTTADDKREKSENRRQKF